MDYIDGEIQNLAGSTYTFGEAGYKINLTAQELYLYFTTTYTNTSSLCSLFNFNLPNQGGGNGILGYFRNITPAGESKGYYLYDIEYRTRLMKAEVRTITVYEDEEVIFTKHDKSQVNSCASTSPAPAPGPRSSSDYKSSSSSSSSSPSHSSSSSSSNIIRCSNFQEFRSKIIQLAKGEIMSFLIDTCLYDTFTRDQLHGLYQDYEFDLVTGEGT